MITKMILLLGVFFPSLNAQIYFPSESGGLTNDGNTVQLSSRVNLSEIRGSSLYEKYVDQLISGGVARLTLEINRAFLQKRNSENDNIVFAPMSMAGALALLLLGSNGRTFEELTSVLGLTTGVDIENKSEKVHEQLGRIIDKLQATSGIKIGEQVNFALAIFVQNNYPIRSVYKETAEQLYDSEVLNVDFQSNPTRTQQTINAWVSDRTNGKIKDILADAPSGSTKVIVASAMYFKAMWEKPFFEGSTARRPFYINGRRSKSNIEVEMMANGGEFPYYKDFSLKCEIMGFPYKGNASVMYVVMPFNSDTVKLKELENSLTAGDLEHLADSTVYTRAVLLFPKMKIESTTDLRGALEHLGVKSLFDPSLANLALLSPGEGVPHSLPSKIADVENNPLTPKFNPNDESVLIFSRFGDTVNCTGIFDKSVNISTCQEAVTTANGSQKVTYKKFGTKIGRRVTRRIDQVPRDTIDNLRHIINQQSTNSNYQNPGLYADKIIHKVYMDITETGTEAAASTSVSLSRDGTRVTYRVDVPFLFFIRHEETKAILFWGSVNTPSPSFRKN